MRAGDLGPHASTMPLAGLRELRMASTSFLPGNGRPSVSRAAQTMHSPRAPTCASAVY